MSSKSLNDRVFGALTRRDMFRGNLVLSGAAVVCAIATFPGWLPMWVTMLVVMEAMGVGLMAKYLPAARPGRLFG